ncbi:hypothetical protein LCGC14_0316110 [marine sediment metagenome]|uniref:Uncharacterized protein n=1 Tax=marine sediment metagenome TaxID=412755 RepID=A0A0F9TQR7_9ZZZZ
MDIKATKETDKTADKTPAKAEVTIEELTQAVVSASKLVEAGTDGGTDALMAAVGNLSKAKGLIAKAKAEALKAEAEALSGIRASKATSIYSIITRNPEIITALSETKAKGFTFTVSGLPDATGTPVVIKSVSLAVPAIKGSRAGVGGGAGKTKTMYGMSLAEVFAKYANADEQSKLESCEEPNINSKQWQIKTTVKDRVVASGELKAIS